MKNESNERDRTECNGEVITEGDWMGLVHALLILDGFRDFQRSMCSESELADALDVIFEWIDNMVLLLKKSYGSSASSSSVEEKEN